MQMSEKNTDEKSVTVNIYVCTFLDHCGLFLMVFLQIFRSNITVLTKMWSQQFIWPLLFSIEGILSLSP